MKKINFLVLFVTTIVLYGCFPTYDDYRTKNVEMSDPVDYAKTHKGNGTKRNVEGTEEEIVAAIEKGIRRVMQTANDLNPNKYNHVKYEFVRENHAFFVIDRKPKIIGDSVTAYFFTPSSSKDQLELEIVKATRNYLTKEQLHEFERLEFITGLAKYYVPAQIKNPEYDPNEEVSNFVVLQNMNDRKLALALVKRGASVELAVGKIQKMVDNCKKEQLKDSPTCINAVKVLNKKIAWMKSLTN